MTRIVHFAVATAMRLDEICRVTWRDLDPERRMLLIRDRKDPRNKTGNDQRIPLFAATGYDAWALVRAQAGALGTLDGRKRRRLAFLAQRDRQIAKLDPQRQKVVGPEHGLSGPRRFEDASNCVGGERDHNQIAGIYVRGGDDGSR